MPLLTVLLILHVPPLGGIDGPPSSQTGDAKTGDRTYHLDFVMRFEQGTGPLMPTLPSERLPQGAGTLLAHTEEAQPATWRRRGRMAKRAADSQGVRFFTLQFCAEAVLLRVFRAWTRYL